MIKNIVRLYGVCGALCGSALLLTAIFLPLTAYQPLYVFSIIAVALCTWDNSFRSGITAVILTSIALDYFFLPPFRSLAIAHFSSVLQLLAYTTSSLVIIAIIERAKNPRSIQSYRQKEKEYLSLLSKMQKENTGFKKEIRVRDEFLSIASHELKTPLSSMLLQIQTALYNIRNVSLANFSVENLMKMLQSAEGQSKRLSKMINDLLNVSLITTGKLELELETLDLSDLVSDIVSHFTQHGKRDGYEINLNSSGTVIGEFDKLRIEQAITNLITNAVKYGLGKPVTVGVKKQNSHAFLTVSDKGIGIPEEAQERIFERFERVVSNHEYKGLGVGLYITYQIVKAHGGDIKVKSELNQGSTFTILLPIKDKAVQK